MSAHTPGPWGAVPYGVLGYEVQGGGYSLAVVNYAQERYRAAQARKAHGAPASTIRPDDPTARANAQLIAAAPDMLATLQAISDRLQAWAECHEQRAQHLPDSEATAHVNSARNYHALIATAHAAIAQATQEAPC